MTATVNNGEIEVRRDDTAVIIRGASNQAVLGMVLRELLQFNPRSAKMIGEDVAEQIEFVPASFRVIRHVRPKFGCTQCDTLAQAREP